MHRIEFTPDDLARVRLLPSLGPIAETVLSLSALRQREPLFAGWRQQVGSLRGLRTEVLNAVVPMRDPFFDLITLAGYGSVDAIRERLLDRSAVEARFELDHYEHCHGRLPGVLREFDVDLDVRREVLDGVIDYHDKAVAPRWQGMLKHLAADRHARAQIMFDGGTEGLLATLHPMLVWESPVLTLTNSARSKGTYHLDGRGIILAPSFFDRQPMFLRPAGKQDQCVLVYPAQLAATSALDIWSAGTQPGKALANLLGRTRALVLAAIGDGSATTSQLAVLTGTSAASISQHTAVLRDAGLITSHRYRNTVHHMIAAPGSALLNKS